MSWDDLVTHGLRLWGWLDVLLNSLKLSWRRLMVEKLTFKSLPTALVDILAVSMPTLDICGNCVWWQQNIFEWPFIVPSSSCVMIMLFNQLLDMPHLSGGWILLAKEKCSLNRDVNKFVHRIWEKKNLLCIWNISRMFYFSSWNIGPTLHVAFIILFSVFRTQVWLFRQVQYLVHSLNQLLVLHSPHWWSDSHPPLIITGIDYPRWTIFMILSKERTANQIEI